LVWPRRMLSLLSRQGGRATAVAAACFSRVDGAACMARPSTPARAERSLPVLRACSLSKYKWLGVPVRRPASCFCCWVPPPGASRASACPCVCCCSLPTRAVQGRCQRGSGMASARRSCRCAPRAAARPSRPSMAARLRATRSAQMHHCAKVRCLSMMCASAHGAPCVPWIVRYLSGCSMLDGLHQRIGRTALYSVCEKRVEAPAKKKGICRGLSAAQARPARLRPRRRTWRPRRRRWSTSSASSRV